MAPKACPFAPLSVALIVCSELSQVFPHVLRHHMGVSSCVKQPGSLDFLLNFHFASSTF